MDNESAYRTEVGGDCCVAIDIVKDKDRLVTDPDEIIRSLYRKIIHLYVAYCVAIVRTDDEFLGGTWVETECILLSGQNNVPIGCLDGTSLVGACRNADLQLDMVARYGTWFDIGVNTNTDALTGYRAYCGNASTLVELDLDTGISRDIHGCDHLDRGSWASGTITGLGVMIQYPHL
jgi:hypothetical protein